MAEGARVVAILGESGGGKSTVARQIVERETRLIVVAPYMKTPYGTFGFSTYEEAKATMKAARPKKFRISIACYTPKELAKACRLAAALAPCTLVLDESASVIPNAAAAPLEFRLLCQVGRHCGIDEEQEVRVITLGQRPPNLPPFCLSESKDVYVFALARETDWQSVVDGFSLPREAREKVLELGPRLPKYHRLRLSKRDDGGWDVHEGTGT